MCSISTRFLILLSLLSFTWLQASAANRPAEGSYGAGTSLEFEENRNQWDASIKYGAALPGGRLFLKQNQWVFSFLDQNHLYNHQQHKVAATGPIKPTLDGHTYTVTFLNAAPNPTIKPARATPGYRNYLLGNDPAKWASEVKAFEQISYQELYSGIEAKLYETGKKLKYDFVVQPKADPSKIQMEYAGTEKLTIQEGNLVIKTSVNTVTEEKPVAYQVVNGLRKEVPCKFKLTGNVLSFEFPKGYRKKLPLIIDPTLVFSSYSGATADNWGFTATYDNQGNMYSGGVVLSVSGGMFPTSPGAFQVNRLGLADIGIIKYNPNASGAASRVWATYIGGSGIEAPHSLVVNSLNQLLILGTTSSSNFPTTAGSFDPIFNNGIFADPLGFNIPEYMQYAPGSDLFIAKLSAAGNSMAAATFLGGTNNDGLLNLGNPLVKNYGDQFRGDIFTDNADNVYIASSTSSPNFPIINGFQSLYGGGPNDAVVCKLTPNLNSLVWSSFLGGFGSDAAYSVQVDNFANVYICGGTTSVGLPQTSGALKPNFTSGPGAVEGFASKISPTGTLLRTTYIGASAGYDQTYFLQLDGQNNVYLLGQSADIYPSTPGVYSASRGRQFIQKLDTDLTTNIFSMSFGSGFQTNKFDISPTAFLVDNCERIFVCGWGGTDNQLAPSYVGGNTNNLPTTTNGFQRLTDGSDFFLMQLSQNAATLEYATFLGGNSLQSAEHVDGGTSRFDKRGFVYHAVCGGCQATNAFPTTPNAWSVINGNTLPGNADNCNNAAFKFDFAVSSAIAGAKQTACLNQGPFALTGATPAGGIWSGPGVTPGGTFDPQIAGLGSHVLTYTYTVGNCQSQATKTVRVVPEIKITFNAADSVFCVYSAAVPLIPSVPGGTFSGPGVQNQNEFSPVLAGPGQHVVTYSLTDTSGCVATFRKTFTVDQPTIVNAGPNEGICAVSNPIQLTGATPTGGTWNGNGVSPTGVFTPSEALIGKQTLTYSVTVGKCTYSATKEISVDPVPEVAIDMQFGNCGNFAQAVGIAPLTVKFQNSTFIGKSFRWNFGDGTTSTDFSPEHTYTKPGTYSVTLETDFGRACIRTSNINSITVVEPLLPNVITPNNDNLNEIFIPRVTCMPFTLKLYNRWGVLVYEKENYAKDFNGSNLSSGVYYYHIRDTSNRSWKGWLEIIK